MARRFTERCVIHSVFKLHKHRTSARNPTPLRAEDDTTDIATVRFPFEWFHVATSLTNLRFTGWDWLSGKNKNASKIWKSLYVLQGEGRVGIAAKVWRTATVLYKRCPPLGVSVGSLKEHRKRSAGGRLGRGAEGEELHGVWCSAYVLRLSTRWVEHVASVARMKNRHKICPKN